MNGIWLISKLLTYIEMARETNKNTGNINTYMWKIHARISYLIVLYGITSHKKITSTFYSIGLYCNIHSHCSSFSLLLNAYFFFLWFGSVQFFCSVCSSYIHVEYTHSHTHKCINTFTRMLFIRRFFYNSIGSCTYVFCHVSCIIWIEFLLNLFSEPRVPIKYSWNVRLFLVCCFFSSELLFLSFLFLFFFCLNLLPCNYGIYRDNIQLRCSFVTRWNASMNFEIWKICSTRTTINQITYALTAYYINLLKMSKQQPFSLINIIFQCVANQRTIDYLIKLSNVIVRRTWFW